MKTDALIAALAADTTPQPSAAARMLRAVPVALLVSLVAVLTIWHVRPDLAAAMATPAVLKTLLPIGLALIALWLARGLSRPEATVRAQAALVAVLGAGVVVALGQAVLQQGWGGLFNALNTPNLITCFVSIPVLSALPLAATLWAMKSGATTRPAIAGAAAGLLAGAGGTAIYSLHCPEDSLLFFVPAYGTNMVILVALGAALGPRLLRW